MMGVEAMDMALQERLAGWVEAGLISREQAQAIREHEQREHLQRPHFEVVPEHGRVPLITEALGYLGAALAVAALVNLLGEDWPEYPLSVRLGVPVVLAVALVLAGWPLRDSQEPAFARFGSVLWFLAVGAGAWSMAVYASEVLEASDRAVPLYAGLMAALVALPLYWVRRSVLQQLALFLGIMTFLINFAQLPMDPPTEGQRTGAVVWLLSVAWLYLGYRGAMEPRLLAYGLGAFGAIQAPMGIASDEGLVALGLLLGLVTSFTLVGASVWLKDNVLLVFGAIGSFLYLLRTIEYFFGDTIGMPLVLLTTGVILLIIAFLAMRGRSHPGPGSLPPSTTAA